MFGGRRLCLPPKSAPQCIFRPTTPSPPSLNDSSHGVRGEQGHIRRQGGSGPDAEGRRHHGRRERGAGPHRRGGWRRGRCVRAQPTRGRWAAMQRTWWLACWPRRWTRCLPAAALWRRLADARWHCLLHRRVAPQWPATRRPLLVRLAASLCPAWLACCDLVAVRVAPDAWCCGCLLPPQSWRWSGCLQTSARTGAWPA